MIMAVQKEYYGHCIKGNLPWGIRCVFTKANANHAPYVAGFDESKPLHEQIDDWADMVHFHFPYEGELHKPFVCTEHSNSEVEKEFPINTIYLSSKHAENNHATCYVHNGL